MLQSTRAWFRAPRGWTSTCVRPGRDEPCPVLREAPQLSSPALAALTGPAAECRGWAPRAGSGRGTGQLTEQGRVCPEVTAVLGEGPADGAEGGGVE